MAREHYKERLRNLWDYLRTSFWFVPSVMVLGAVLLLFIGDTADRRLLGSHNAPWFVYVSEPDQAREVLSTLLSSMITMASLVFSITMVVLSLAASQYGPRLIRSFMASPHTQVVLGTFVMTIVYCLLLLSMIGSRSGDMRAPFSSVSIAIALTLASIGLLVFFIHTLARSIVSETVIERVGDELDELLESLEPCGPERRLPPDEALPDGFESQAARFGPGTAGYVQAIEFDELVRAAEASDAVIGLFFRAGDYVAQDGMGIGVFPPERLTDRLRRDIKAAILIGAHRTPVQDPDFSIRHLVEIAVRALSPGVNDPYTAVAVIDRLSASLSRLMGRMLPKGVYRDTQGIPRVMCPRPTYSSLLGGAFDQIRQNGADKPLVVIHLLRAIARIADHARLPDQRDALGEQFRIIAEAAERKIDDPSDRADVAIRVAAVRKVLDDALPEGSEQV